MALAKNNFTGKNFGYYSIATDTVLDIEPLSNSWDLVFSKYMEDINGIPYSVTGIRTNIGVEAVKVYPVNDVNTYDSTKIHTYSSNINTIGHDWKKFNFNTFSFDIEDSTVYFVKTDTNTFWKLVMKGFGGSANGNFIFEKTKVSAVTGLFESPSLKNGTFKVYPNPTSNRNISIVPNLPNEVRTAQLNILNINGQLLRTEPIQINNALDELTIQLDNYKSGIYFIQLNHKMGSVTQRLIIK